MKKFTGILVVLFTLVYTSNYAISFPYTGKFLSSDGSSLVGNTTITVGTRLYESPEGGLPLVVGSEQTIVVEDGIFQVNVGPVDGIDLNQFSWLELVINGEALSPRRALNYTPLAVDSQRFSGMSSQEWQERFASLVSSNQDLGYLTSELELIQASILAQSAQISALETSQLDLGDIILLLDENIFQTILAMEALTGTLVNLEQGQTNLESQLGQLSINQLGSESAIANLSNAVALLDQQGTVVNSTLDFHSSSISGIQTSLDFLSTDVSSLSSNLGNLEQEVSNGFAVLDDSFHATMGETFITTQALLFAGDGEQLIIASSLQDQADTTKFSVLDDLDEAVFEVSASGEVIAASYFGDGSGLENIQASQISAFETLVRSYASEEVTVVAQDLDSLDSSFVQSLGNVEAGLRQNIDNLALSVQQEYLPESELQTTLETYFVTIDSGVLDHLSDVSNPHAVTASQVGLGNVQDLDVTLSFTQNPGEGIITSFLQANDSNGLSLLSSAGNGITVMDNGFTGINNGDPQAMLDVAGSIEADSVSVEQISAQTVQATDLNLGSAYGQAVQADELLVSGLNTPSHPFAVYTSYFNFEGFPFGEESPGQEFPPGEGEFVFVGPRLSSVEMYRETDPLLGAATFVITTSGHIGMGTTRPLFHLDIIGDLNVEGEIFVQGSPLGLGGSEEGAGTDSAQFGHFSNDASGDYSFIGGGTDNYIEGVDSASLGGTELVVTGVGAVAAGGYRNYAQAENSIVAGGQYNVSDGFNSAVVAGQQNLAISTNSFVAGGYYNEATGVSASVIGGSVNTAAGFYSSVIGGAYNQVQGDGSIVLGGSNNVVDGMQSGVLAGTVNQVTGNRSAAIGGVGNWVQGDDSLILVGSENYSYSNSSVVIGGAGIDNYANNNFVYSSSQNSLSITTLQSHTAIFDVRRLGVGETAPIAKLHVTGNGTALNDASAELENLDPSGFTLLRLRVPGYSYKLGMGGPTATHNQNSVYIWDEVSSTTRMLINSAGYMGVSTDTPIAPLHVGGAMAFDNTTFDFDPGLDISFQGALIYNEGDFYAYNGEGWDRFLMEGGAAGYIQDFTGDTVVNPTFDRINFEVRGTQRMTLFEEGYLGIGTNNPAHMLHITTDVGAATILLDGATDAQVRISANSDSNFSNIDFAINGVTHGGLSYDHNLTDASEMLKFNVGGSDKVYFGGDGSVGINNSNMSETLDVEGTAQVTNYLCVGSDIDCGTVSPQQGGIYSELTGVTGADYAEYFPSEGTLVSGDLVGLNALTGKVRKYQSGDKLMGIASTNPGIIGGANRSPEDHALVGLMGQLPVNQKQVQIDGRVVQTLDGVRVGLLLSDGTVYINLNPASEVQELRGKLKKQEQQIEELQDQVRFLMQKMK